MRKVRGEKAIIAITFLLAFAIVQAPAQKFTVLYNFAGPPDGEVPEASLIDVHGVLYGTTLLGGTGPCAKQSVTVGCGTIFRVSGKKETVLYSFQGPPDGAFPAGGLLRDKSGNLYGATSAGGAYGYGAIFKLRGKRETVLYSFKGPPDGATPLGTLVQDLAGNLYGVTSDGGSSGVYGGGTLFQLTPEGNETVLYSFCSQPNCTDGASPSGGLVMDGRGNLYGTTGAGGLNCQGGGCGTVFVLDTYGDEGVLYSFCSQPRCADGAYPEGPLLIDATGNFYGATVLDGPAYHAEAGVLFRLNVETGYTVLYPFCSESVCSDGSNPAAGLIMDANGNLYGTTMTGGGGPCEGLYPYNSGCGAIFELAPNGTETLLHGFAEWDGAYPTSELVFDAHRNIFGTTSQGGRGNCTAQSYGCGVVFKIHP